MAEADYASVTDALVKSFENNVAPLYNRSHPLLSMISMKYMGQKPMWDMVTGSIASDGTLAMGDDVSTYNDDTLLPATLGWGSYSEAFGVDGAAIAAAKQAGNPSQLFDLLGFKMLQACERLAAILARDCIIADGTSDAMMGITATNGAFKATGTYAGVVRGTYPLAAGNEYSAVGAPLDGDVLRDFEKRIYDASGFHVDAYFCDSFQHAQYGKSLGQQRRYLDSFSANGKVLDSGYGIRALEHDGVPVIRDQWVPAGMVLAVSWKHLWMSQLPPVVLKPGDAVITLRGTDDEKMLGASPLQAKVNLLAMTGDSIKYQLVIYPQIICNRPNACGMLTNLALA